MYPITYKGHCGEQYTIIEYDKEIAYTEYENAKSNGMRNVEILGSE